MSESETLWVYPYDIDFTAAMLEGRISVGDMVATPNRLFIKKGFGELEELVW